MLKNHFKIDILLKSQYDLFVDYSRFCIFLYTNTYQLLREDESRLCKDSYSSSKPSEQFGAAGKKSYFLVARLLMLPLDLSGHIFFGFKKKSSFFLLAGPLKRIFFAASLTQIYSVVHSTPPTVELHNKFPRLLFILRNGEKHDSYVYFSTVATFVNENYALIVK